MWSCFLNRVTCLVKADSNSERQTGGWGVGGGGWGTPERAYKRDKINVTAIIVQELCESRGGRPELSVLTSLLVSVDVKNY